MKELTLNVLDAAKNSVKAGASRIVNRIEEQDGWRSLSVIDSWIWRMAQPWLRPTAAQHSRPVSTGPRTGSIDN